MGYGLVGASSVDEQLGVLIKAFFVGGKKSADKMLDDPGVLSSFGVRIELAFLLGLISASERRQLDIIRKIRNDFAHTVNLVSFAESRIAFSKSSIADRCRALDITKIVQPSTLFEYDINDPFTRFSNACVYLWVALIHRTERIKHREEAESFTEDYMDSIIKKYSREPM
jgi:hypothetical protein